MGKEAFAFNNCLIKEKPNVEQCSAPAPDSLRLVAIGGDFVELSWLPAWEGARQNVEVFIRTNETDWMPQYVLDSVVGTSIVLAGLDLTQEYGVKISTYCPSGELSTQSKFIDGINLIIDLAVAGRTPINPTFVKCNDIPLSNEWIGFQVGYNYQGIQLTNTFEFTPFTSDNQGNSPFHVVIRRVTANHPIVACDDDFPNFYPSNLMPIIENIGNPIRMDRLINSGSDRFIIGNIGISLTSSTVSLCPVPNSPWDQNHSFNAITANNTNYKSGESQDRESLNSESVIVKYLNPIDNVAQFNFINLNFHDNNLLNLIIYDMSGRALMEKSLINNNGLMKVDVDDLDSGVYIFFFISNGFNYATQIIKR